MVPNLLGMMTHFFKKSIRKSMKLQKPRTHFFFKKNTKKQALRASFRLGVETHQLGNSGPQEDASLNSELSQSCLSAEVTSSLYLKSFYSRFFVHFESALPPMRLYTKVVSMEKNHIHQLCKGFRDFTNIRQ